MKSERQIESKLPLWKIPREWLWVLMGDVATIIGGGTPSTTDPKNFENGDISWITPADLSRYESKYISRGARNLSLKGLQGCGAKLMPPGTVLLSSRAPIGYIAIAGNSLCTNQGFKSFILGPGIKPDYVYYYLKRAKNIIIGLASGTTFLELSGAKAALIPMPIVPVPEQHRIVEEIEKQFTRLDAAVDALKRVKVNLKRYRTSVLKAACEGRLVSTEAELAQKEGRFYEPANVLLKRILKERRAKWEADQLAQLKAKGKSPKDDKWKEKYKTSVAPDTTHLPKIPEGWVWATVASIGIVSGGKRLPNGHIYSDMPTSYPYLRVTDFGNLSIKTEDIKFLKVETQRLISKYTISKNDIYISIAGSIGKVGFIQDYLDGANLTENAAKITNIKVAEKKYLVYLLNSNFVQNQIKRLTISSNQPKLALFRIEQILVPLAPITEQIRIVTEIERRLSIIEELETIIELNLKKADRLRQSILKRAFEGKLIPQNPNDEPASVLLDRIREERIKSENEVKPKTKTKRQKQKVK